MANLYFLNYKVRCFHRVTGHFIIIFACLYCLPTYLFFHLFNIDLWVHNMLRWFDNCHVSYKLPFGCLQSFFCLSDIFFTINYLFLHSQKLCLCYWLLGSWDLSLPLLKILNNMNYNSFLTVFTDLILYLNCWSLWNVSYIRRGSNIFCINGLMAPTSLLSNLSPPWIGIVISVVSNDCMCGTRGSLESRFFFMSCQTVLVVVPLVFLAEESSAHVASAASGLHVQLPPLPILFDALPWFPPEVPDTDEPGASRPDSIFHPHAHIKCGIDHGPLEGFLCPVGRSLSSWSVGSAFLSSALRLSTFTGSLHLQGAWQINRSSQKVAGEGRKPKGRGEIEHGMPQNRQAFGMRATSVGCWDAKGSPWFWFGGLIWVHLHPALCPLTALIHPVTHMEGSWCP